LIEAMGRLLAFCHELAGYERRSDVDHDKR
jgi:hypothetical protein